MKMTRHVAILVLLGAATVEAQPSRTVTPLELEIAVGELAYTVHVLADSGTRAEIRAGQEVAVPVRRGSSDDSASDEEIQYRNVGLNLTVRAYSHPDGRFRLQIGLERSSLLGEDDPPSFRIFSSSTELLVREGETATFLTGTDPASGEEVRAELTLRRAP